MGQDCEKPWVMIVRSDSCAPEHNRSLQYVTLLHRRMSWAKGAGFIRKESCLTCDGLHTM